MGTMNSIWSKVMKKEKSTAGHHSKKVSENFWMIPSLDEVEEIMDWSPSVETQGVSPEKIDAIYDKGLLCISLPKISEHPQRIP